MGVWAANVGPELSGTGGVQGKTKTDSADGRGRAMRAPDFTAHHMEENRLRFFSFSSSVVSVISVVKKIRGEKYSGRALQTLEPVLGQLGFGGVLVLGHELGVLLLGLIELL